MTANEMVDDGMVRDAENYVMDRDPSTSLVDMLASFAQQQVQLYADAVEVLRRLRQWDYLDTAADGEYWKGQIDQAIKALLARETECLGCGASWPDSHSATCDFGAKEE